MIPNSLTCSCNRFLTFLSKSKVDFKAFFFFLRATAAVKMEIRFFFFSLPPKGEIWNTVSNLHNLKVIRFAISFSSLCWCCLLSVLPILTFFTSVPRHKESFVACASVNSLNYLLGCINNTSWVLICSRGSPCCVLLILRGMWEKPLKSGRVKTGLASLCPLSRERRHNVTCFPGA